MDILVTYEDGTTELRAANSYVHWAAAWRLRGGGITRRDRAAAARGSCFTLNRRCNGDVATVWRTTWDPETKALSGAWVPCRVETTAEQIERLTRERDAAEKRLADLRAWAKDQDNWDGFHVPEVIAEILNRTEEEPCSP